MMIYYTENEDSTALNSHFARADIGENTGTIMTPTGVSCASMDYDNLLSTSTSSWFKDSNRGQNSRTYLEEASREDIICNNSISIGAMWIPQEVSVMLQVADEDDVLANLEDAIIATNTSDNVVVKYEYSPAGLLPKDTATFFRYEGSLTTPPCTEGVIWTILAEPRYVRNELNFLREHATEEGDHLRHNWRPTQPLNNRVIYLNRMNITSFLAHLVVIAAMAGCVASMPLWYDGNHWHGKK
ncbi:carbonate dehydratase, eukaryotic-type [Ancylostoma ceylanicum]|uniref:carbonic anhydrase n=1 Tax=Ancylostoma ceylanicum TaxID=53326 RepID=A0A0D6LPH9_9BILA|nr:carbonate dehydratase, eukaryotic-type [Ancylostoma ceylanicum]